MWTGKAIIEHFGRTVAPEATRPTEFARFRNNLTANYAPSRVGKMVTQTRMMFRWAFESEVIEAQPNFGPDVKSTSKRASRIAKAKRVEKLFSADQIHESLDRADDVFRAMILLGINCGMGNTDISQLSSSMIDSDHGWIDYPRPKTGVDRRMPLWSETLTALKRVLKARPTAVPVLLMLLELEGAFVTLDAMHTQVETARAIVKSQADYVMTVKQNQPQLHERLTELFEQSAQQDYQVKGLRKQISQTQRSHGRIEQRSCYVISVPKNDPVCRGSRVRYFRLLGTTNDEHDIQRVESARQAIPLPLATNRVQRDTS